MLKLAENRAKKNKWTNITFLQSPIEELDLHEQVDFAFFAFCWYDTELSNKWVRKVEQCMDQQKGRICFLDYKLPNNWLRPLILPIIWIELKLLAETYGMDDLKWDPSKVIGGILREPKYIAFYFDCLVAVCGRPIMR
jgi:hypothetical protein